MSCCSTRHAIHTNRATFLSACTTYSQITGEQQLLEVGEQSRLRFLVGQRFGALLASFHDELIQGRIDGEGIIPVEASEAKTVQGFSRRANPAFDIDIRTRSSSIPTLAAIHFVGADIESCDPGTINSEYDAQIRFNYCGVNRMFGPRG
jgi:hypothetical protein